MNNQSQPEEKDLFHQDSSQREAKIDYSHLCHKSVAYDVIGDVVRHMDKHSAKMNSTNGFTHSASQRQRADTESPVVQPTYGSLLQSPGAFRRQHLGLPVNRNQKENLIAKLTHAKRQAWEFLDSIDVERVYRNSVVIGDSDSDSESEGEDEEDDQAKKAALGTLSDEEGQQAGKPLLRSRESSKAIKGLSVWSGTVTLIKSFIGTYLLYLPHMFQRAGLVFALGAMAVTAGLSLANQLLLLDCREAQKGETFGGIAKTAFGPWAKLIVDISITISQMGYCVAYFTYVAQNLQTYLPHYSIFQLMALQLLIYIPLTCLRHLRLLSPFVYLANIFMFTGLLGVIYYIGEELIVVGPQPVVLVNTDTLFIFIGSIAISFEGTVLVIPTYDALERKEYYRKIVKGVMLFLFVFYCGFAAFAYLAYGEGVQRFVTLNIPQKSAAGVMVKFGFIVSLMVMFPLMMFPVSRLLERVVFGEKVHGRKRTASQKVTRLFVRSCFRAVLVILILLAAVFLIDYYDHFNAVVGAICVCPLAMFLPAMFHLKLFGRKNSSMKNFGLVAIIVYGFVAMSSSLFVTVTTWNNNE